MNKILAATLIKIVLIAAALSSTGAFAADRSPGSIEDGKQRADSGVIGHDACIMLDQRIDCAAMPN